VNSFSGLMWISLSSLDVFLTVFEENEVLVTFLIIQHKKEQHYP
jgi:hypothetical protein